MKAPVFHTILSDNDTLNTEIYFEGQLIALTGKISYQ